MRISDWSSDVCSSDLRQLALDLVHRADAGAGLHRRRVDALVGDQLLHGDVGPVERLVGAVLVADLPGEDVVVVAARPVRALGLAGEKIGRGRVGKACVSTCRSRWSPYN